MMTMNKTRLALAVAGAVSLVSVTAHAADFGATTTLQNTLEVTVVQELDLGTIFATATGTSAAEGVGALVIAALDGAVTDPATDSAEVNLTSLSAPTPAQGSVAMAADFTLTFTDTSAIDAATFGAAGSANIATVGIPLSHESADPAVPDLFLMHFTVADVSGGVSTENAPNDGSFEIEQDFGETEFVFNIGATLTTAPFDTAVATYEAGIYAGTFEVTAAY